MDSVGERCGEADAVSAKNLRPYVGGHVQVQVGASTIIVTSIVYSPLYFMSTTRIGLTKSFRLSSNPRPRGVPIATGSRKGEEGPCFCILTSRCTHRALGSRGKERRGGYLPLPDWSNHLCDLVCYVILPLGPALPCISDPWGRGKRPIGGICLLIRKKSTT